MAARCCSAGVWANAALIKRTRIQFTTLLDRLGLRWNFSADWALLAKIAPYGRSPGRYFLLSRVIDCVMASRKKSPADISTHAVSSRFANVNGVRLHLSGSRGTGDPVVLLHGYAETSHMWRPLMAHLAKTHTVIAPDLRGAGQSSAPAAGYTKAEMAQDIHALALKLGYRNIRIVGHDIGLMVAYAYAAQYSSEVDRIALMDAFLPGVGDWRDVWLMRDLWHFHFYGKTPLALVHGRERIYFEHFWNDCCRDPAAFRAGA